MTGFIRYNSTVMMNIPISTPFDDWRDEELLLTRASMSIGRIATSL